MINYRKREGFARVRRGALRAFATAPARDVVAGVVVRRRAARCKQRKGAAKGPLPPRDEPQEDVYQRRERDGRGDDRPPRLAW